MEKLKEFIKNNKYFLIIIFIIIITFIILLIVNKDEQKQEQKQVEYVSELENIVEREKNVLTVGLEKKETIEESATHTMEDIYNGYPIVGKIEIPKTNLEIPIISSVSVGAMEQAPCLLYTTGELNKNGNTFIVGHNYQNDTLFSNNGNLEVGDKIKITTLDGNVREYTIYNIFVTDSSDVSYLKREIGENPEITLQSCTDDNNDDRLIIEAK